MLFMILSILLNIILFNLSIIVMNLDFFYSFFTDKNAKLINLFNSQ